ncbi:MAG TPA: DNRLRE domain-containing protein, partial [Anaerolineae bacterium]
MKRLLPTLIILVILAALVLPNVQPAQAEARAAPLHSAAASMAIFKPVADTYIADDVPTSNFGSASPMYVGEYDGGAQDTRSLLKFDLTYLDAVNATVTGATLTLTVS